MGKEHFKEIEEKMKRAVEAIKKEFQGIRTGKPSIGIFDEIKVSYYGSIMPLNQVATLKIAEGRMIMIQPWDRNILGDIEKAILKSNLGLTPQNDGQVIRVNFPPLTEERRKELVKVVHKEAETGRVAIRNIRRDYLEIFKKEKTDGKISEDEFFHLQEELQKLTDKFINEIEKLVEIKEKEIMEI
ncbi:MAG TPA: ribosome recycling factor [Dictyoglomaceae bacterium]|nr:ribosome recycling factor [Dictyoglomaceae bacterium]HOL39798.1 ribosome recycling factor [Dictyoglomaceae bacterium]HOP95321.1 ribosome recycling factor [Dictyoglomaceae bacterium]HPP16213.1 ribosome recycling factor [Dictyoglomaceae bacterium]HPU42939.1 ribosome recycling factor [Dictyoglomaceae bacterium]